MTYRVQSNFSLVTVSEYEYTLFICSRDGLLAGEAGTVPNVWLLLHVHLFYNPEWVQYALKSACTQAFLSTTLQSCTVHALTRVIQPEVQDWILSKANAI